MTDREDNGQSIDTTQLDRRVADILERLLRERGLPPGGSGSGGGGVNAWQQSVENRLGNLQSELLDIRNEIRALRADMWSQFRWLLGLLITMIVLFFGGFGSLLAVMARGFGWL